MRILLTICMLGFIALGFSACGNDDDRVALVRSEAKTAMQQVLWNGADTKSPKAPKGKSKALKSRLVFSQWEKKSIKGL